jgi:cation diffusion facilitator family transporter
MAPQAPIAPIASQAASRDGATRSARYVRGISEHPTRLTRYAWLSIAAAVVTMSLKGVAAALTGSVGLLSDAMESVVNLVAAVIALLALRAVGKDPDEEYTYGRAKAEYLSAGVEGTLIVIAAASIAVVAVRRLLEPAEVARLGIGFAVSAVAALANLGVALVLLRAGRRHRSITLEADGKHLMTDVWTSAGVLAGFLLVAATGWRPLDPIVALGVAVNIVIAGWVLIRRSVRGLLDASLPAPQRAAIEAVLDRYRSHDVDFHAIRTRQAGSRAFMTVHVLVPGERTVLSSHDLIERIEHDLHDAVPQLTVTTHLEPLEDPRSFADESLDRRRGVPDAAVPRS